MTTSYDQASWELNDDIMTIIGKRVLCRRNMESVISQIREKEEDWYSSVYDREFEEFYYYPLEEGLDFGDAKCTEEIFRFHQERNTDGFWIFEKIPPQGMAQIDLNGVNAIKTATG